MEINRQKIIDVCKGSISMRSASQSVGIPYSTFIDKAKEIGCYKPNQGLRGIKEKRGGPKVTDIKDILSGKYPNYSSPRLRKLLVKEGLKKNECEICFITEWNSKPLTFHLHHKDGNKHNHFLYNLQILCPNCHEQTENHGSKNIKCYGIRKQRGRLVRCIETNEIFKSQKQAADQYSIDPRNIGRCCVGKQKIGGGLHWEYVSMGE